MDALTTRCIGHHHTADEPRGCLNLLIRQHETEQQANGVPKDIWNVSVTSWSLDELVDGRAGIRLVDGHADEGVAFVDSDL